MSRQSLTAVLVLLPTVLVHAEQIRWISGASSASVLTTGQKHEAITAQAARAVPIGNGRSARHIVVQFDSPVEASERASLNTNGMTLLKPLGDHAYFASIDPASLNAAALSQIGAMVSVAAIERSWKIHPGFAGGRVPAWSVVRRREGTDEPETVALYLLFHPDAAQATDGVLACARHGAIVRAHLKSVNGMVVEMPLARLNALADEDIVQWLEPPLPPLGPNNDGNRVLTQVDTVQVQPYGLNGAGVNVLVYDAGTALGNHRDFGGRLAVRDSSPAIDHATHVAGTIGGDGSASGGAYRGMASAVVMQSYGLETDGSGLFLYTNPGDIEDDYLQAISYGADVANNSIGTNICSNGYRWPDIFLCAFTGNYGVTDQIIDGIVRGSLGVPFRVLWANGNERGCTRCLGVPDGHTSDGYHSTAPPACAKNHVTVGAVNSDDDSMTVFSSWGPTDDGRLKPDVCAPGDEANGALKVMSTTCNHDSYGYCTGPYDDLYEAMRGTSMAAPTVTGIAALMLQDYRAHYPGRPDFRNSTLKILLAHNAFDRVDESSNPGPDYKFGYGSVRAQDTIDFMRTGNFREMTIEETGDSFCAFVDITESDIQAGQALKVTLAWDDYPGTPNVSPALVNDLDLRVYDPSGTVQYYPWTLNPASPADVAVRTQPDHLNNIEQVVVDPANLSVGLWRVEVYGYDVPEGPQPFSVCASPSLIVDCNCNQIADGQEADCNANGMLDQCDLEAGFSPDCNQNSTPDECDPDADGDGRVDGCDNCLSVWNPGQENCDEDGIGDACDTSDSEAI